MHEVIGHGSGRMAPGVTEPPHRLLAEQYSSIEEAACRSRGALLSAGPQARGAGHCPWRPSR